MRAEIKIYAEAIIKAHDGQMLYSLTDVKRIIGCGINNVAHELHKAGILVKPMGTRKTVNAYDIAELMCAGRIAPIQ